VKDRVALVTGAGQGIRIGSTEADLRRAYGSRLQNEPNHYREDAQDMWIDSSVNGQARSIRFVVVDGKIANFRAGEAGPVGWIEHCL